MATHLLAPRVTNLTTIGAGTGSFAILSALKHNYDISAIVSAADNGGHSGELRIELDVLPPGDARQALAALVEEDDELFRKMLQFRMPESGGSVGNYLLAALEHITGSNADAIRAASRLFKIRGEVLAVTQDKCQLQLTLPNGTIIDGEDEIGENCIGRDYFQLGHIPALSLTPSASLNPDALQAFEGGSSRAIIICPGKLYSSIVPNFLVKGMAEALRHAKQNGTHIIYVANLMTQPGQTDGFRVADFVEVINHFAGGSVIDTVLYNNLRPSQELLDNYAAEGEIFIEPDPARLSRLGVQAFGTPLISNNQFLQRVPGDKLKRTLIRHDHGLIREAVLRILSQPSVASA